MTKRVSWVLLSVGAVALMHCVGDDPATTPDRAGDHDAASTPDPANDASTPPKDASEPADTGSDANADDAGTEAAAPPAVTSIAVGSRHACATRSDGSVVCWGDNRSAQAGAHLTANAACTGGGCVTRTTVAIGDVDTACAGTSFTCAVKHDGTVWCWGNDKYGQLGHASASDEPECDGACNPTPALVAGVGQVTQLACGGEAVCARTTTGDVYCWGENRTGVLALPAATSSTGTPTKVALPEAATDLSVSLRSDGVDNSHACAVVASKAVYCWGGNAAGELGVPTGTTSACDASGVLCTPTPQKVMQGATALAGVRNVRAGLVSTCAVLADHTVSCWGSNGALQQGLAAADDDVHGPANVAALGTTFVNSIDAHFLVFSAIDSNNALHVWGRADPGAIGDGALAGTVPCGFSTCTAPKILAAPTNVMQVAAGTYFSIALDVSGQLWGWGRNDFGQLGHDEGTANDQTSGATVNASPTRFDLPN